MSCDHCWGKNMFLLKSKRVKSKRQINAFSRSTTTSNFTMQRQKNSCRNCRGNSPQRREFLGFEKLLCLFFPLSVFFFCLFLLLSVTDHISRLWSKLVRLFSPFITILKAVPYLVAKGTLISRISDAVCSASLWGWEKRMDYVLLPDGCLK